MKTIIKILYRVNYDAFKFAAKESSIKSNAITYTLLMFSFVYLAILNLILVLIEQASNYDLINKNNSVGYLPLAMTTIIVLSLIPFYYYHKKSDVFTIYSRNKFKPFNLLPPLLIFIILVSLNAIIFYYLKND